VNPAGFPARGIIFGQTSSCAGADSGLVALWRIGPHSMKMIG